MAGIARIALILHVLTRPYDTRTGAPDSLKVPAVGNGWFLSHRPFTCGRAFGQRSRRAKLGGTDQIGVNVRNTADDRRDVVCYSLVYRSCPGADSLAELTSSNSAIATGATFFRDVFPWRKEQDGSGSVSGRGLIIYHEDHGDNGGHGDHGGNGGNEDSLGSRMRGYEG